MPPGVVTPRAPSHITSRWLEEKGDTLSTHRVQGAQHGPPSQVHMVNPHAATAIYAVGRFHPWSGTDKLMSDRKSSHKVVTTAEASWNPADQPGLALKSLKRGCTPRGTGAKQPRRLRRLRITSISSSVGKYLSITRMRPPRL